MKKPEDKKHWHWHHIVPKHAGGTDDADNLVLLSPIDHANAHIKRFEEYKNPADLYAAKILMGSLKEDGFPVDMTGIKRPELAGDNNPAKRPEVRAKISAARKGIATNSGYTHSDEFKQKMSLLKKGIPTGIKTKGSTGMKWWNNGSVSKMAYECPDDTWKRGRI